MTVHPSHWSACYVVIQNNIDPYGLLWNRVQDTLSGKQNRMGVYFCAQDGYCLQEDGDQGRRKPCFSWCRLLYCYNFHHVYVSLKKKTEGKPTSLPLPPPRVAALIHLFAVLN